MSTTGEYLQSIFGLDGKVIALTGAAGGIGRELAKGLAFAGAAVALCDVNEQQTKLVESELCAAGKSAKGFQLNVMDSDSIESCAEAIMKAYGQVDVVVNCAGINVREGILDVNEETYDRIMGINMKGVFFFSQRMAKEMIKREQGNFINIGSHNDEDMLGGCSVYGATKSGVVALTRAMAVEWARYNIRANAISPGHIITPLTTVTWEHPTRSIWLRDRIAMRRPGTPEELIGICIMLASDASSYMSGQAYHVDGGCLCGGSPWEFDTKY